MFNLERQNVSTEGLALSAALMPLGYVVTGSQVGVSEVVINALRSLPLELVIPTTIGVAGGATALNVMLAALALKRKGFCADVFMMGVKNVVDNNLFALTAGSVLDWVASPVDLTEYASGDPYRVCGYAMVSSLARLGLFSVLNLEIMAGQADLAIGLLHQATTLVDNVMERTGISEVVNGIKECAFDFKDSVQRAAVAVGEDIMLGVRSLNELETGTLMPSALVYIPGLVVD